MGDKKLTIASDAPGARMFMLGNEAIARGAIEAGVEVVAAYPGTPSSEINEAMVHVAKEVGFYAEWSVNEKVAFEVAMAASACGKRAMTMLKCVGLNVAQDPLITSAYAGVDGGFVLVDADDPGQWSSQTEQDNRYIAELAYVPVLEPSCAQEAKDMTADAFRLSEQFNQIFMMRSVTRISHARSDIELGPIDQTERPGKVPKEARFVCLPNNSRANRKAMLERFAKIREATDTMPYNRLKLVEGAKLGIIACGISYSYTVEALRWLGIEDQVSVLKIGTPHPLPPKLVEQMLRAAPKVLVIEEVEPFVENHVKIMAQELGILIKIHGKDVVPIRLDLSTRKACEAIAKIMGVALPVDFQQLDGLVEKAAPLLPVRPPALCAGCPHRASFYALNVAARKVRKDLGERMFVGDIGCYALAANAPLKSDDMAVCMGAGFGAANGAARAVGGPVVGHLGDSTFFHSGIPPLVNAVFNNTNVTMVVVDNSSTAMTGFQPNPSMGAAGNGDVAAAIHPEDVARACGVKFVEVVDPFEVEKTIDTFERAMRFVGPSVVVTRRGCEIIETRERRRRGEATKHYVVNRELCTECASCIKLLGCPAIIKSNGEVTIDDQCVGCAVCATVCPSDAIVLEEVQQ